MEVYHMKWKILFQIKISCSEGVDPFVLTNLILNFANVTHSVKINNIKLIDFNQTNFGVDFFKNNILTFCCDTIVKEKIDNWFLNKFKFKKFTYEDIDYEILDILYFDEYKC